MNLIDGVVTKVLSKKRFVAPIDWGELCGKEYDIYKVEYFDEGGIHVTDLWFDAELNQDVQEGYKFLH